MIFKTQYIHRQEQWQKVDMTQRTRQMRKPPSSPQTQGMMMMIITPGITPANSNTEKMAHSKEYQPVTPTERNPLNQVLLPPHLVANKYLWPQEQGSPKRAGLLSQKPLSVVSQQNARHGVRLKGSSRWLTKANLRLVTK